MRKHRSLFPLWSKCLAVAGRFRLAEDNGLGYSWLKISRNCTFPELREA